MTRVEGNSRSFEFAGWWQRVGATLIDWFVIGIPALMIGAISRSGVFLSALFIVGPLTYATLMLFKRGRTVGMDAVSTRCVSSQSSANLSLQPALLRAVIANVYVIAAALGLGRLSALLLLFTILDVLWPLWDARNQTLHDKAVGSIVVSTRAALQEPPRPGPWVGSWGGPPAQGGVPTGWTTASPDPTRAPGSGWSDPPRRPPTTGAAPSGPAPSDVAWGSYDPNPGVPQQPGPQTQPRDQPPQYQSPYQPPPPTAAPWGLQPLPPPQPAPPSPPPVASIPAAWYPDPAGSGQQRWWDGKSWTEHLRPHP